MPDLLGSGRDSESFLKHGNGLCVAQPAGAVLVGEQSNLVDGSVNSPRMDPVTGRTHSSSPLAYAYPASRSGIAANGESLNGIAGPEVRPTPT